MSSLIRVSWLPLTLLALVTLYVIGASEYEKARERERIQEILDAYHCEDIKYCECER